MSTKIKRLQDLKKKGGRDESTNILKQNYEYFPLTNFTEPVFKFF